MMIIVITALIGVLLCATQVISIEVPVVEVEVEVEGEVGEVNKHGVVVSEMGSTKLMMGTLHYDYQM